MLLRSPVERCDGGGGGLEGTAEQVSWDDDCIVILGSELWGRNPKERCDPGERPARRLAWPQSFGAAKPLWAYIAAPMGNISPLGIYCISSLYFASRFGGLGRPVGWAGERVEVEALRGDV